MAVYHRMVTHPTTGWAQGCLTSLIETNVTSQHNATTSITTYLWNSSSSLGRLGIFHLNHLLHQSGKWPEALRGLKVNLVSIICSQQFLSIFLCGYQACSMSSPMLRCSPRQKMKDAGTKRQSQPSSLARKLRSLFWGRFNHNSWKVWRKFWISSFSFD